MFKVALLLLLLPVVVFLGFALYVINFKKVKKLYHLYQKQYELAHLIRLQEKFGAENIESEIKYELVVLDIEDCIKELCSK